jgi:CBS domain-containing protein
MDSHRVGALPVVDRGKLVGIISEGDHARRVILTGRSSPTTPVSAVMTRDVITVTANHSIEDCLRLMTDRRVKHLPVLDGQRLLGVISLEDVGRATISEREFVIEQMQNYISGGW